MAMTTEQRTEIIKIVVGMFGAAPGATYLSELSAYAGKPAQLVQDLTATGAFASLYPNFLTNQEFATNFINKLLGNTVTDTAAKTWAINWMKNGLDAGASRGKMIFEAIKALDSLDSTNATWGAAAKQFDNKVAAAEYYSVTMGAQVTDLTTLQGVIASVTNTTDVSTPEKIQQIINTTPGGTTGQTFTLTVGQDYADTSSSFKNGGLIASDFKFTSGNEKVTAGAGALNVADALADGSTADADVLDATLTSGALLIPAAIQNIETINLTANVANSGLDFTNISGTKTVTLTGAANAQLANLNATAAPTIVLNNYTKTATIHAATLAGTSDALSLKVSGATATSTVIPGVVLDTATAGALETLNLESAGTTKNTIALTLDTTAPVPTALNKTVVTGAADLDLRVAHGLINGQTLDASGHTGALNLVIDRNTATTATTNLTNASGVDTYTFIDSTAGGDALVASGLANGAKVVLTYGTTGASSLAVKGAASGSSDVLNLLLDHATDATDVAVAISLTISDVETINITSEGGTTTGNSITALTVSSGAKVTVDGSTKLDLQLAAASLVSTVEVKGSGNHKVDFAAAATYNAKNLTIDGSAATGKLTLDGSDFAGTAGGVTETLTIMGGSNDDTITGTADANAKNVIDAGAGKDTVNVTTANNSNVTLGAGADELIINGVTGVGSVTVTDFALGSGGDKLSVNTAAAMTFGGVGAASVDNQLIILNVAVANDAAAATAVQGGIAALDEKAVILLNNASGVAELWYFRDADGGADVDAGETVKLATFENITTVGVLTDATSGFVAANFGTWA